MSIPQRESWDCMIPGPPSRSNGDPNREFRISSSSTLSNSSQKLGIQDLCWIQTGLDSWAIAALSGPSLLSIYSTSSGRCLFKCDASPEHFSCLCRDPSDSRLFCDVGLKGFLLSIKAFGDSENDVANKELLIRTDPELQKLERDSTAVVNGSPELATFPNYKGCPEVAGSSYKSCQIQIWRFCIVLILMG
ncbi:unnamed protein product [Cuscuta campestris]|uniref:WDR11 first beta-propeller domain-containing protein n=1 Tax=Cuscuta campestris TaxID=132261 RepID=A0A484M589_9ASTE|nr:unnamed protein product [Cuscuta campestris]